MEVPGFADTGGLGSLVAALTLGNLNLRTSSSYPHNSHHLPIAHRVFAVINMMTKETLREAFIAVARPLKLKLPSPKSVLRFASLGTSQIPLWNNQPVQQESEVAEFYSCPSPQLSCKVEFNSQDRCCFNYPGGQLLQTQFWDADPPTGPEEGWTIHGLWPDHCDGSYDQYCDSNRRFQNISSIIKESGQLELLDLMRMHWKDFRGDDEDLWEHEWNKHGTCISTLEPRCYPNYVPQQEVVTYFQKTVDLFLGLPSYEILSVAGIVPSDTQTYDLDAVEYALKKAHGHNVVVRCRNGALNEIWYHFNVAGPLESGKFVPAIPVGGPSNCPRNGIRYKPKNSSPRKPSSTRTLPKPTETPPTGTPFVGKGNLMVQYSGRQHGCIISRGSWFAAGTCATFRAFPYTEDDLYLKSSKGLCGFDDDDNFICGADIDEPTAFTAIGEKLSLNEQTVFYSDAVPRRRGQSIIYESSRGHPLSLEIHWRGV
ncbi:ribonuclease T2 [Blastomyces gilchristii SLH14081]|uniref:Ribonuclease T2-like n=1 Tax=Blastomyces gilchristii (strain SLH14081) TaxID=559298 RepID=A0A179UHD2_BLAGS|nr:ribonuclease T2 [Blastomyces gilchristii SLH14081]OAT06678.1 ribonuclease T2 [Blastomyces gilchristii SLH14081]